MSFCLFCFRFCMWKQRQRISSFHAFIRQDSNFFWCALQKSFSSLCACENENDSLRIVKYLIEKGVSIEAKDKEQKNSSSIACEKSHLPNVEYLVEKGANIEVKDEVQFTPLHIACQ